MTTLVNRCRSALNLFLFLAAFFILWTLRATVFYYAIDESIWPPTFAHIANNILSSLLVASHA